MVINDAAYADLSLLVNRLREKAEERAKIPARSGNAKSEVKKERRKRRAVLKEEMYGIEKEIVNWSLHLIPVEDEGEDERSE